MTRLERWSVGTTSAATTVTGVVYLWMKYFLPQPDEWAVVNHPLQPAVLKLHIIVAPLLTFAIGMIALRHVWRHLRERTRDGRRSGLSAAVMVAPMILTGYLIQAVTHEGLLKAMAISHIALGLVYAVGLALHQVAVRKLPRGRRRRRRRGRRATASRRPVPPPPAAGSAGPGK